MAKMGGGSSPPPLGNWEKIKNKDSLNLMSKKRLFPFTMSKLLFDIFPYKCFFVHFCPLTIEIKRHNGDSKTYSMEPRKVLQNAVVIN